MSHTRLDDDIRLDAINDFLNSEHILGNLDDGPSEPGESIRIFLVPTHLKPLMRNEFKSLVGVQLQTAFLAVFVYDERLCLGINGQLHRLITFLKDGWANGKEFFTAKALGKARKFVQI